MGIERKPTWRDLESMEEAAARLLAGLDARAEKRRKAAGRLEGPAEITDRPLSPDEKADGASNEGLGMLKRRPQFTAGREELAGGDPVAEVGRSNGIGNTGGQAGFGISSSLKYKDTARPNSERPSLLADRTDPEGPMLRRIE
jgi:hypothetical protein